MEAINWLTANWAVVLGVLAALHAAALIIVNATPTPRDDEWVGRIYKVIEMLAGLVSSKTKQYPGEVPGEMLFPKQLRDDE